MNWSGIRKCIAIYRRWANMGVHFICCSADWKVWKCSFHQTI